MSRIAQSLLKKLPLLVRLSIAALLAIVVSLDLPQIPEAHARVASTTALVYRDDNGPAGCSSCAAAAAHMLVTSPWHFKVLFVGPQGVPLTARLLHSVALYVQPGGNGSVETAYPEVKRYAPLIRNYVKSGGRYLGLCMGAYLAGTGPGFNLLKPDDSNQYITSPRASITTAKDGIVDVIWRGQLRKMYFQDGPSLLGKTTNRDVVLARYINKGHTRGPIAVLVRPYGAGKVGFSGPHPEASLDWYNAYHLPAPPGLNVDLANDLLHTLMG